MGDYIVRIMRPYTLDASIDIGIRTFTLFIVENHGNKEDKGTSRGKWKKVHILRSWDLAVGSEMGGKRTNAIVLNNLISVLDSVVALRQIDRVFIEQQFVAMGGWKQGKKAMMNDEARKLQWALHMYFVDRSRKWHKEIEVIPVPASLKTKGLGCPKGLKKLQYKEWCWNEALRLLDEQRLRKTAQKIRDSRRKKFDRTDAVCQYRAGLDYYCPDRVL